MSVSDREKMIQLVKDMGQQLIDDAEKIIPTIDCFSDLNILINVPTITDRLSDAPSYSVSYDYLMKRETAEKYFM